MKENVKKYLNKAYLWLTSKNVLLCLSTSFLLCGILLIGVSINLLNKNITYNVKTSLAGCSFALWMFLFPYFGSPEKVISAFSKSLAVFACACLISIYWIKSLNHSYSAFMDILMYLITIAVLYQIIKLLKSIFDKILYAIKHLFKYLFGSENRFILLLGKITSVFIAVGSLVASVASIVKAFTS